MTFLSIFSIRWRKALRLRARRATPPAAEPRAQHRSHLISLRRRLALIYVRTYKTQRRFFAWETMTFRPFENPRINTAKQPSQSPSRRRRPPHPGRIDEQRSSAQFAHLQTLRIHMPALKAATSINSRRGLAPAPSAIKAIMAVSHQSSFASHDRSIPPDDKTNRRRNLRTTALRQAVRARKPFGKKRRPPQTRGSPSKPHFKAEHDTSSYTPASTEPLPVLSLARSSHVVSDFSSDA